MDRFKIIEGSELGHCCITHSVIDTTNGEGWAYRDDGSGYQKHSLVCECVSEDDATMICMALNKDFKEIGK